MQQTPWDFIPWRFVLLILAHIQAVCKIVISGKKWVFFLVMPALRRAVREPRGSHAGATVSGSLHQTAAHGRATGLSSCGETKDGGRGIIRKQFSALRGTAENSFQQGIASQMR